MKHTFRSFCWTLLAAAALSSCDPGPQGLFSLLEEEKPLNKGTKILNSNTASFVLRFEDYYYTAVGSTLLRRPVEGGAWVDFTVDGAPTPPSGSDEIYVITSGVVHGGSLYLSYAPVYNSVHRFDGTNWAPVAFAAPPDEPVQSLLAANGQLFAATSRQTGTSTSNYETLYSLYYLNGASFDDIDDISGLNALSCGRPSSAAHDGGAYWIIAGNTVLTGVSPADLDEDPSVPSDYINAEEPVFSVLYDGARVIASGTGYLFNLTGGYARSSTFGSSGRRLSSAVIVPSHEGGNAVVVGVKPWASDGYLGYYEYDADLNDTFGGGVTPDTAYTLISTNSNYVTTLDDEGIEGFFYDPTGYTDSYGHLCRKLFARTVNGGLWSNTWDTVDLEWSGWDRE